mmetsp:Transcript_17425/g.17514  ORF Transcript_17425/g.17514 Transcript_17425/m.17514 type:complete len:375 (-) Transcript_17425:138-1262(-)|eukprot:CAMPEP_0182432358 /NCGR_PEP_ID=MMETSP1167-20130531/55741_1 /TAXON_ID=2988 /ORGANISM="Mallomonas Sp, Strain CCMP3275" /LENGTH=374 /DNA_ID=CAMNT_0024619763 /DNA_START=54 /DNA_END=1178 /DNA_ORIENTATION=-
MKSDKPNDANEGCVGPSSDTAGKASACEGCPNQRACATGAGKNAADPAVEEIKARLASVKHKILVLSGKGGVGKSTFSAQLAFTLANQGKQVGLLDIDICGPSIPRMLGLLGEQVHQSASGWSPVYVTDNLGVMSIGFMLPSTDDAVIWRGPKKNGLIKQFLSDVEWGELDYLIIDTPPGTSDEHISIVTYLKSAVVDGAIVITTPQEVSMDDVRKEISFCKKTGIEVLGVVENMSSIAVPLSDLLRQESNTRLYNNTGEDVTLTTIPRIQESFPELFQLSVNMPLFTSSSSSNTPSHMACKCGVPYLGGLPMDPNMLKACEEGLSLLEHFPTSPASKPFEVIANSIVKRLEDSIAIDNNESNNADGDIPMDQR